MRLWNPAMTCDRHQRPRGRSGVGFAFATCALLAVCALATACGSKSDDSALAPRAESVAAGAPTAAGTAPAGKEAAAKPSATEEAEESPEPVAAPAGATPGDVIGPGPKAARRLGAKGAAVGADGKPGKPLQPEVACDELAPDSAFKLANKVEISLPAPAGEEPATIELCLFHKSTARQDVEKFNRTGRQHAFVAAFPGREVAIWTADELQFEPATLPADAAVSASGWAALLATGLDDRVALAVASARFYDGGASEMVRTVRVGRVLEQKGGRWGWQPLTQVSVDSLDLDDIDSRCKADPGADGCAELVGRAERWRADAEQRLARRQLRLEGKAAAGPKGKPEGDPQSEWLRRANAAIGAKKPRDAVEAALHVEMLCGEAIIEARAVYAQAARLANSPILHVEPKPRAAALCGAMADRGGPARK